jgi:hypothetical protein
VGGHGLQVELEFFNGFRAVDQSDDATQFQARVFNSPGPTDAWMRFKSLPLIGNLRIGSQKEPFSLEHRTTTVIWSSWSSYL